MDSLIQGVSQQPPHVRVVGQGEEQINGWSSPVEGLTKRNPSRLIARILNKPIQDFYLEMMDVSATEQYSVLIYKDGTDLKLDIHRNGIVPTINLHGTGMTLAGTVARAGTATITIASGAYLYNGSDWFKNYVLINNGPLGLLLNREKVVKMDPAKSSARGTDGLIFIQAVAYEVTYKVSIDGTEVASYTTPKASDTNNKLSTTAVANALATAISSKTGFTAVNEGYVVRVRKDDGTKFDLSVDDGRSGALGRGFTDKVTTLSELPTIAPNGFVVNVQGDPSTDIDDRWIKFTTNDGVAFGDGSWGETIKPGIEYKIDPNTMPLVIYRSAQDVLFIGPADGSTQTEGSETYTFPSWAERTAGDEETVPSPEFINQKIRDHVLFRSRYIVCAGVSVVLSETNDVFNFFQDSSVALTETDPFSLRSSSERSSELNWLLPVDESILAFSQYSQFQVRASDADVLTPITGTILRLSNIQGNPHVRPKLAGPQILFPTDEYGYSHFREFTFFDSTQRRTGLNLGGSSDITLNIPKYIDGLVTHWDVGETVDTAVTRTAKNKRILYVYKYLWQSGTGGLAKSQASWSKWEFDCNVEWVKFMDNQLWLVLTDANGTYSCTLATDEIEMEDEVQLHLDRLLLYPECNADYQSTNDVTATYDSVTNTTTFVLPYKPGRKVHAVTRLIPASTEPGLWLGESDDETIVCSMPGDHTAKSVGFGEEYDFTYEFSNGYLPTRDEARSRVIGSLEGRTQVLRWTLFHFNTGYYQVRVKRKNREFDSVHTFRARFPNVWNNKLNTERDFIETGSFRVPVCSRNTDCTITVESSSWLPLVISGASWEGAYSDRNRGAN